MGNIWSRGRNGRRRQRGRRDHPAAPPPQPPQPEITANRYVFAAVTPYPAHYPGPNPSQHPNPNPAPPGYYQYPPGYGYYSAPPPSMPPMPLPAPYDHHHQLPHMNPALTRPNWVAPGRHPCGPVMPSPAPYVEHQKAVTIRNDVNLKKETLKIEPDGENPGKFLVSFMFDAAVGGSITIIFFAKEGEKCDFVQTNESVLQPVTVHFQQGLGQKFNQPSGTGIDFSMFEESELVKESNMDIIPLAIKAEACPADLTGSDGNTIPGALNSQITLAVFEKDKGEYVGKVVKQILWVNGMRYELLEIYGIGNSVEAEAEGDDPGKECVICLSEPRDTTVLPCRHMCMCSGCAKMLRFQTNRCPICRQPVERLLEIKVSNSSSESTS